MKSENEIRRIRNEIQWILIDNDIHISDEDIDELLQKGNNSRLCPICDSELSHEHGDEAWYCIECETNFNLWELY